LEKIVRDAVETGAALAGMLQTENIGIEKVIANIVANPNIRYLILCAIESQGHLPGETLKAVVENGVDERKRVIGTEAPTPYLYNIPNESIDRFRKQIKLVDLLNETDIGIIKEAVRASYQENPTKFRDYVLYDQGAYPEPPICKPVTWRIKEPWAVAEGEELEKMQRIAEQRKR
jgi:tetrahydromethanopterin S-methyltransferase subunit A